MVVGPCAGRGAPAGLKRIARGAGPAATLGSTFSGLPQVWNDPRDGGPSEFPPGGRDRRRGCARPTCCAPLEAGFEAAGIEPFDERDDAELEQPRRFILRVNRPAALIAE